MGRDIDIRQYTTRNQTMPLRSSASRQNIDRHDSVCRGSGTAVGRSAAAADAAGVPLTHVNHHLHPAYAASTHHDDDDVTRVRFVLVMRQCDRRYCTRSCSRSRSQPLKPKHSSSASPAVAVYIYINCISPKTGSSKQITNDIQTN